MRVLVVEDEPLIRLFVADILEDVGFTVAEAANAAEAVSHTAAGEGDPFVAVVIDVGLPDKRGDELARELRRAWPDLPIVIASGHDKNVLAQNFAGDGKVRVLGKPYYGEMLLDALRAMGVTTPSP